MLSEELIAKVKRIEIATRKIVNDVVTGQYKSRFKGTGMQFSEHRVYLPGDDIRHIDWKASARNREPLIKKYEEERELNVLLVVDVSRSKYFGTKDKLKSELAAEMGGMIAYAAKLTGDKAGAILFAGEVEHTVTPGKGRSHVMRVIRDLLSHKTKTSGTDLKGALESADRVFKHAGVIFIISDFQAEGYEISLRKLCRRHDVVAIWINDPKEEQIPEEGIFYFEDPESGEGSYVNTGSYAFKKWLRESNKTHTENIERIFKTNGIDSLRVRTHEDYGEAIVRFFKTRYRRKGR